MNRKLSIALLTINTVCLPFAHAEVAEKQNIKDVIPMTVANIEGQKNLYKEGWFIITSSEKAMIYAKEQSIDSSFQAIQKASKTITERSNNYLEDLSQNVSDSKKTSESIYQSGSKLTDTIFDKTNNIARDEWTYSKEKAAEAWQSVISGYVYLRQSSQESLNEIKKLPGNYSDKVYQEHSEMWNNLKTFHKENDPQILVQWDDALESAETEFKNAYLDSGDETNSMSGLWTLLSGYVSGAYKGIVKPAIGSSWQVSKYTATIAGEAVFLPLSSSYILTKNTVQSAGLAVYYTGKTAIEVVSPTLKGGYLTSLSLLSSGSVPLTYLAGTSLGMVNQVGTYVSAPVAGAAEATVKTASDTLEYGALVTYDAFKGSTKVFVNQMKSGVVLGYNALTAIPSQLLLGSVNSAIFLVWDGPKLTLATLNGEIRYKGKILDPGSIPVGSVIDLKELQAENPGKLEVLSDDPSLIDKVLDQLPKDLRL
ncbi:hypothetical protein [Marinomonas sp. PE14-40]|uniref:hypothetical protein n=1 Tax=Marinomonas sp. PE14-40 TaxID=3060621 RepID=UPI003F680FD0